MASTGGSVTLSYTPTATTVTLQITRTVVAPLTSQTIKIKKIILDSITFGEQLVNATVCNEEKYEYGYNGQMKVNDWAGVGNHTTAKFWEYDTRTGRRDNLEPKIKEIPWLSAYATNHNNPNQYKDPNGDFGVIGGAIGAGIGFLKEYTSQVVSNVIQRKGIKESFATGIDWADVCITTAEYSLAGATGGVSLLAHGAFAAARVSVDYNPIEGNIRTIGGVIGDPKSKSSIMKDAVSETIGFGIGIGADATGASNIIANSLIGKGSSINKIITAQAFGTAITDFGGGHINGIENSNSSGNPFQSWGEQLDKKNKKKETFYLDSDWQDQKKWGNSESK